MVVRTMRTAAILAVLCATAVSRPSWQYIDPDPRALATMVIDTPNQRAVLFGGGVYGEAYNNVWAMSLDTAGGYGWELLPASGPAPTARTGHAAIFDPVHNWMVIFGGRDGDTALTDVWALDLGTVTWQQLAPSGTPPSLNMYITAVYSPARRSMIVFGGTENYHASNEVYELLLDSMKWHEISPSGTRPEARWSYNVFLDADSNRLIVFGGQTQSGQFVNDVWALALTPGSEAWTELKPGGDIPEGRSNCATGHDEAGHRAYFFGGFNYNQGVYYNDLYMLDMSTLSWTNVNPGGRTPLERRCATGAFDPWNRNFITFGGETHDGFSNEWPYIYVGKASDWQGTEPGQTPSLQVSSLNPRQVSIRFLATGTGTVGVKVTDQSGRLVRNLLSGTVATGSHDLVWDGNDERGKAVASGIYFCRLETEDTQLSKKFVLAR